jgi:hypothetical protein
MPSSGGIFAGVKNTVCFARRPAQPRSVAAGVENAPKLFAGSGDPA